MTTQAWAVLLGAYLLGSIPTAYLVSRWVTGSNILETGDGNMGAKNTFQSVGHLAGVVVGLVDVTKGALTILMARQFALSESVQMLAGVCVVLGHDYSLFLRFRGGQGMAAMVGVFAILFPRELGLALLALAVMLSITHNWDLSCCIGFGLFPVILGLGGRPTRQTLYPVLMLPTIGLRKLVSVLAARRVEAG